jgi:hypothetical protein
MEKHRKDLLISASIAMFLFLGYNFFGNNIFIPILLTAVSFGIIKLLKLLFTNEGDY